MTATTAVDVEHVYHPRGSARALMHSRAAEVLVSGPAGTGKSRACLEKLHTMALLEANAGMRGLIVRKTLVSLGSTALETYKKQVAKEALAAGIVKFYGGSPQEQPGYRYPHGSFIAVGGLDRPSRIMSSEYDIVYVQEATELDIDDWEAVISRLRHGKVSFQQIIADCNPNMPTHWLKVRADSGATAMLHSQHEENPLLFTETGEVTPFGREYLSKLDSLTGVRYQRLRKGLWVAAEGIIYEDFDPSVHVIDPFPIPWDWPRYWVVDFGYVNPFVLQWWAEDPDGRLYLYREIYRSRQLVEDHARAALACVMGEPPSGPAGYRDEYRHKGEWTEPRPTAVICDHDAEDRATLERHLGMSTVAATKTVSDGIQAAAQRLRLAADGRPRAYFFRDAVVHRDTELEDVKKPCSTVEEFSGYVWDTGGGKKLKEAPFKENDHGLDGYRYLVAERDLGGRPRVRWL